MLLAFETNQAAQALSPSLLEARAQTAAFKSDSGTLVHAARYGIVERDTSTPSEKRPRRTGMPPVFSNRSTHSFRSSLSLFFPGPTTILRSGEGSFFNSPSGTSI